MKIANQLELAKNVLKILDGKTMRRMDWQILCVSALKCAPSKFDRTLSFLVKGEYVERIKRGTYRTTEKGQRLNRV